MRGHARGLAIAAALASLASAIPARADDVADAKARFRKGVALYKDRRWREAVAEFEAAYRLKPHGVIHFNVAQCRERLQDWPGALRSYHDYLREVPDASDRAAVRASMGRIEERLAKAGVQILLVYTDPPGARLSLDGVERGTTPLHAVLAPGSYALALSLDGHEPVKEQVDLSRTASRVLDVVLRPAPRAPPAPPPSAAAPDLAPRAPAPPGPVAPAPPPPARARRHLAAWIAAGTAVAAAAAGAYLGWSARQDEKAIDALAEPDRAAATRHARDAEAKARAANALYAVAGGSAAVGAGLLVLEARF
jgi:tetratricopeptide (TPR) repeat protein